MANPAFDVDQVLKSLASQSIKQGSDVRAAVRNLTLKALQQRELTLDQIGKVLRSVTEGVTLGVAKRELKVEKTLSDTVAGMDDAMLRAVEASNVALHRLTGEGYDFEDSDLKRALDELEKLEDQFLQSIEQATDERRREDQGAVGPRAGADQAVGHRHRHAGRVDDAGIRKAGTGGNARAARDGLQDRASAHAELRDPGQRNTDRHVRGIGRQAGSAKRLPKSATGRKTAKVAKPKVAKRATAKSVKRVPAKSAKRPAAKTARRTAVKTAKRAKATTTRKSR